MPDSESLQLTEAVIRGNEELVVNLLKRPGSNEYVDKQIDGLALTPLLYAAYLGREAIFKHLLETGRVNIYFETSLGYTALTLAASRGHIAVAKLLLPCEVCINRSTCDGSTPLSLAAAGGHNSIVDLLLSHGAHAERRDEMGRTPLFHAAGTGNIATVNRLLAEDKVNADSKDTSGETPLSHAAYRGNEDIVRRLLDKGVDADWKNEYHRTPLSSAGSVGVVKALLETGRVNVDSTDMLGRTPLSRAAEKGDEGIVKALLASNADKTLKDKDGQTPLDHASKDGNPAVVKLLCS